MLYILITLQYILTLEGVSGINHITLVWAIVELTGKSLDMV